MSARALVLLTLLVLPGPADAGTPGWEAVDHLGSGWGTRTTRSGSAEAAWVTREAMPETFDGSVRLVITPHPGIQAGLLASRFAEPGFGITRWEAAVILPVQGARVIGGLEQARFRSERASGVLVRSLVPVTPRAVADVSVRVPLERATGTAQWELGFFAGDARWLGSLGLVFPQQAAHAALGLRVRSGVFWMAGWDAQAPFLGVHLTTGRAEIRLRAASHPLLGTLSEFRVVWGGAS